MLYDSAERDAKFKEILDTLESQKSEYHEKAKKLLDAMKDPKVARKPE